MKQHHTGDDGRTFTGRGRRVEKHSDIIELFGALDELITVIGIAEEQTKITTLKEVQNSLYQVFSIVSKEQDINKEYISCIERKVEKFQTNPAGFVRPVGRSAYLHLARTVCRKAERRSWKAGFKNLAIYLNRLSDYLFLLAVEYAKKHDELEYFGDEGQNSEQ